MHSAKSLLSARSEGNAIRLSPNLNSSLDISIKLIATTVTCSATPKSQHTGSGFVFYPEEGYCGVVAVRIHASKNDNKGRGVVVHSGASLLRLIWKKDEETGAQIPWFDFDNEWFPSKRIGHVGEYSVEATIDGRRYMAAVDDTWAGLLKRSQPDHTVTDTNLLLHYLWGSATRLDVIHAAVEAKVEASAPKRIEKLTRQLRQLIVTHTDLQRAAIGYHASMEEYFDDLMALAGMLVGLKRLHEKRLVRWLFPWILTYAFKFSLRDAGAGGITYGQRLAKYMPAEGATSEVPDGPKSFAAME